MSRRPLRHHLGLQADAGDEACFSLPLSISVSLFHPLLSLPPSISQGLSLYNPLVILPLLVGVYILFGGIAVGAGGPCLSNQRPLP